MPASPESILRDVFGLPGFRPGQAEVVAAQLAGRDVLSVAPTGSGKSISYWVPAVSDDRRLTLVVSPLIALMKDQVDRLRGLGVAAGMVNSSLSREEQLDELDAAEAGRRRMLYLAPERLSRPGFLARLGRLPVGRVVVDEAHCISTWGHDFRPDYRLLGQAVEACGRPPLAGFTATATPRVREDIAATLGMRDPLVVVTGFNRPNLRLSVTRCRGDRGKREELQGVIDPGAGRVIVYTGTVAASEEVAAALTSRGLAAACYHGRLEDGRRRRVQEDFTAGRLRVVVATSAFGMGVDLPDIRQVIHYHLPGSIEAYYQEAGRAGRDGAPAECIVLFSPQDRDLQAFFIEQSETSEAQRDNAYARLNQAVSYAHLTSCRHARIADYFGETGVPRTCAACDNCLAGPRPGTPVGAPDATRALAAIGRLSVGAANVAAVLGGRSTAWTRRQPWAIQLPFFGALSEWHDDAVRELLRQLVEAGYAAQSHGEYPTLGLTDAGRAVLRGELVPEVTLPPAARVAGGRPARQAPPPAGAADAGTVERLRRWRSVAARDADLPAYVVFHDRTLIEIAARRPASLEELAAVPGIGPAKLERYGEAVLAVLVEAPGPGE